MAVVDRHGLPFAVGIANASPHESKLVELALEKSFLNTIPERLIGDKAYDSNKLDERLRQEWGIEMIAPHINRAKRRHPTQDGRPLRRYCRRWKVERFFAWLYNFRRLTTRWERNHDNFLGFVQLACLVILLRYL
jgi:transposase